MPRCVCACRVLQQNSEYIPNVLAVFLGDAGIGHPDEVSQCDAWAHAWHSHTSILFTCHATKNDTACCLLLDAEAYPRVSLSLVAIQICQLYRCHTLTYCSDSAMTAAVHISSVCQHCLSTVPVKPWKFCSDVVQSDIHHVSVFHPYQVAQNKSVLASSDLLHTHLALAGSHFH